MANDASKNSVPVSQFLSGLYNLLQILFRILAGVCVLFGLIAIILPLWTFYMHGGPIYLPLASVYGYFGFSNYFAPASIVTTLSNVMPLFVVLGLLAKVFDKISDGFERLD